MVTWPVTMKLFPAKCHEQGTLRKLWRQTGNSSLLPAKCWPLLHVIRECIWRWPDVVAGISARYSKFAFVLFCYITFLSRETLKFSGNKIHCSPRDQSLSVYCYIPRLSLSKTSVVFGWFLVTCPWSNLNVSRLGYNWAVVTRVPNTTARDQCMTKLKRAWFSAPAHFSLIDDCEWRNCAVFVGLFLLYDCLRESLNI